MLKTKVFPSSEDLLQPIEVFKFSKILLKGNGAVFAFMEFEEERDAEV